MADSPRDQQLQIEIVDGRLVISIGVDLLVGAVLECPAIDSGEFEVADVDVFAREIAIELEAERSDDGTNLVHQAFDRAAELAIEDGCDGVIEVAAKDAGDE